MRHELRLPQHDANDAHADVVRWLVPDGAPVRADQDVIEVETSKAVSAVAAGADGYLQRRAREGDVVATGTVLAVIADEALAPAVEPAAAALASGPRFSDGAMQAIRRHGLDTEAFAGHALVTAAMVDEFAAEGGRPVRRPLDPGKRVEVRRLAAGPLGFSSALTIRFDSAPIRSALLRGDPPQRLFLPTFVHRLGRLLPEFPELNACFADEAIDYHPHVDVGIALDLGHGLRVPVIHRAETLGLTEIADRLTRLTSRYQARQLSAADVAGGTVTVSDLSGDSILQFQPLVNQGQSLAIGLGGDRSVTGFPMTVTAVFDHRVSSGRQVADLLRRLRQLLEDVR